MKSHFLSVGLLTEFPWIIVNVLCSAATGEARLVWLQQMHLYQGFNYPDSWIGLVLNFVLHCCFLLWVPEPEPFFTIKCFLVWGSS